MAVKLHFIHSWSKWENFVQVFTMMDRNGFMGPAIPETARQVQEDWQKRTCLICGKEERREIEKPY